MARTPSQESGNEVTVSPSALLPNYKDHGGNATALMSRMSHGFSFPFGIHITVNFKCNGTLSETLQIDCLANRCVTFANGKYMSPR